MVYAPHPPQKAIRSNLRHLKRSFSHEPTHKHADSVNLNTRPLDSKRSRSICQPTLTPTDKYLSLLQDFFGDGDDRRGEGFKPQTVSNHTRLIFAF